MGVQVNLGIDQRRRQFLQTIGGTALGQFVSEIGGVVISKGRNFVRMISTLPSP